MKFACKKKKIFIITRRRWNRTTEHFSSPTDLKSALHTNEDHPRTYVMFEYWCKQTICLCTYCHILLHQLTKMCKKWKQKLIAKDIDVSFIALYCFFLFCICMFVCLFNCYYYKCKIVTLFGQQRREAIKYL